MPSSDPRSSDQQSRRVSPLPSDLANQDDNIDLRDVFSRLARGLNQILGLALLGLMVAAAINLVKTPARPVATSTRVVLTFPGLERGEYPDRSNFQPDDLRSPGIIAEACKRQSLDATGVSQGAIREALTIEGIASPDVLAERDRLSASGQVLPRYIPNEYMVSLTLPAKFPLSSKQREQLLDEIINVYRENFQRDYADPSLPIGNAFTALREADYSDYEPILDDEIRRITTGLSHTLGADETVADSPSKSLPFRFLSPHLSLVDSTRESSDDAGMRKSLAAARLFRSPSTHLSFSDLLEQTRIFAQTALAEPLELIRQNAVSRDRNAALARMNYQLQALANREREAMDEDQTVKGLLAQVQQHIPAYILGIISPNPERSRVDQGADSLLADFSANYLVRCALETSRKVAEVQTEKEQLAGRIKIMESSMKNGAQDQSAIMAQVDKSLAAAEISYEKLMANIRSTQADFAAQQFANAVQVVSPGRTDAGGGTRRMVRDCVFGLFFGAVAGMGLALLGVYFAPAKKPTG